ncbi:MAG: DUF882 domain-containing protein [Desulfopila sp.]|nr:DUF882 domain-containing protein [Desulfopila sp.]
MNRRAFLLSSVCAATGLLLPQVVFGGKMKKMPLNFYHTHTGEKMVVHYQPGLYKGSVRRALEYFLRDFRTGEKHPLDPLLFDSLHAIQKCCGKPATFEIISGYRSPKTNEFLRKNSSGVARKSWHMQGRAIDIRVSGLDTAKLRDLALEHHKGGVGFYAKSDFIHLDTGRQRTW